MAALKVYMDRLDKKLHEKNKFTDYLEKAEKTLQVKRVYLVSGLGVFWMLYMMIGYGAELVCNFIGFLYPAYASITAIESHNKDDDTKWLTYWVVFAFFSVVEFFSDVLMSWVPFYWLSKCLFLIWCFAPIANNGSHLLYYKFIQPFFLKNRQAIDSTIKKAVGDAAGLVLDASKAASGKSE